MQKPGRPLGLSLAIFISLILFSLLPLAQVVFVLSLQQQFQSIEFLESGGAIGGDLQVASINLVLPAINGLLFFIVAILAWRGRPPYIRFVFVVAVIFVTGVTIVLTAASLGSSSGLQQGFDSGDSLSNSLLTARAVVSALVALYVVWYVNRGPARAFYRGYFLPDPDEIVSEPDA